MRLIKVLLALLFVLAGVLFSALNRDPVRVDLGFTVLDTYLGAALLFALLAGALLAGLPMFFFPFDRALPQLALTATVASMITLLLFTIQQIERPFADGRVTPTAYEETLTRLAPT